MTVNSDGRYYWTVSALLPQGAPIDYIGDPSLMTGTMSLTWSVLQIATDGSVPALSYSTDGGATFITTTISSVNSPQANIKTNGQVLASLTGATGLIVNVATTGGTPSASATPWIIAVALNRNINETLPWDAPNPFDPIGYNAARGDNLAYERDTLANLRQQVLVGLGFANQAVNPPPGMAAYVNNKLKEAQDFLYRRYTALHTQRMFRWKIAPNQRFYSLADNDDDPLSLYHIDPLRPIDWAGIQDTRNVWYPLIEGIPPQLYTMIDKTWRPARYTIRQALEVYPAPDQTYWLWLHGHFRKLPFVADGDYTTIDSNLVFLQALANAKAHYGQPDANNLAAQANAYRGELIAGTHLTAHYVPGTIAVPPAVRPTLIQYQDNQGG